MPEPGQPPDEAAAGRPTVTHAGPGPDQAATLDVPHLHPAAAAAPADGSAGRYQIIEEVARGGMGAVYRVHDPELRRDLAIKALLADQASRPAVVQRFLEEAQITGQLQHPGVVPVHEVGRLADGRPFFSMKLVKGSTLAALLRERPPGAPDLLHFLSIFERVCQTIAYAHSRRVIHRDLKPANVMVGAFGEVQVMDWGLAKLLTGEPLALPDPTRAPGATIIRTTGSDSGEGDTRTGQVMGTPAYMPPEQALGEVETLDARCDVFSLGAILCEVLTGQPPYVAGDAAAQLRRAARADLADAFARLDGSGADAELVALAKRCLAAEPADRPRDADDVAQALALHRAGVDSRARRAELERAAAESRVAEERKRRRVQLALAASVVLLLLVGGGGAWWLQQQRQARQDEEDRRRSAAIRAVESALEKAQVLLAQAAQAPLTGAGDLHDALVALRQAEELAQREGTGAETVRQVAATRAAADEQAQRMAKDRKLLNDLLDAGEPRETPVYRRDQSGRLVEVPRRGGEQLVEAFRTWGLDVDQAPTADTVERLRTLPAPVAAQVVAALDRCAEERRRQGRPGAECRRLADLAAKLDEAAPPHRVELRALLARGRLPVERLLCELSESLMPAAALVPQPFAPDRTRLRALAASARPADEPVPGIVLLAQALRTAGEEGAAEALLRDATRARPGEVAFYNALGQLLAGQDRWSQVVECYTAARALRPGLGVRLAEALERTGRQEQALLLLEELVTREPDNPDLHLRHGRALLDQDQPAEAEAAFNRARALRPDHAFTHAMLGFALRARGELRKAEDAYRRALAIAPDYGYAHAALGGLLNRRGRWSDAERASRRAVELEPDERFGHVQLALALKQQDRLAEAETAYRRALELGEVDPATHCDLGDVLCEQGKFAEALTVYRRAQELDTAVRIALVAGERYPSRAALGLQMAEAMLQTRQRAAAVDRGAPLPDGFAEQFLLLHLCTQPYERRYLLATRIYALVTSTAPGEGERLSPSFDMVRFAALAASGQGTDADGIGVEEWGWLQAQALHWFHVLLRSLEKAARFRVARAWIPETLNGWKTHPDLVPFRDPTWLAAMPEPDRAAWQQLWADVDALLAKATAK